MLRNYNLESPELLYLGVQRERNDLKRSEAYAKKAVDQAAIWLHQGNAHILFCMQKFLLGNHTETSCLM
jgi:hypothetical protein